MGGDKGDSALPCPPPAPPPGPARATPRTPGRVTLRGRRPCPPCRALPPGAWVARGSRLSRAAGGAGSGPRSAPRSGAGLRTFAAQLATDGEQEEPMEKPNCRQEIKLLARESRADSQSQIHPQPPPAMKSRDGRRARRWLHNRAGSTSATSSPDCWHLNHPNKPGIK